MNEETSLAPRDLARSGNMELLPTIGSDLFWAQGMRETHLRDYIRILRKHMWLSLMFLLTVVTVVSITTFRTQPVYEAVARVEVDRELPMFLPSQGGASADALFWDIDNYIQTQSKILQSETIALRTIDSLNLAHSRDFGFAPSPDKARAGAGSDASQKEKLAVLGTFLGRLSVKRIPESHLLEVKFEAHDPKLAAEIVNAHIQNFVEFGYRTRFEATTKVSNWLAQQLDELKIKVEKSEDARLAYERQNQIWTVDEKQNITTQKLSDLNRELTQAQADRIHKEANFQLAQSGRVDSLPLVRENTAIQDLIRRRADLSSQYTEALNQFGPKYPKVARIYEQLKEMDQWMATEKKNIVNALESEYRVARQRETLLDEALEKQKAESNAMAESLVQYNILKREAEANKQLYEGLLQKLKEASISVGLRSSDLRVVDPALVPGGPSRPQKTRNILLAVLVGLVGGLGLAFLREYMDNTIKTPDDVERLGRLPALAVIPSMLSTSGWKRVPRMLRSAPKNGDSTPVELLSHDQPQSQVSEAFRALRTSLLLSQAERPPQVVLVTSALPREGKTTAALNLAVTLAQLGDRTLLVDGDMRKPTISQLFQLGDAKHAGLSTYLAGVSSLDLVTVPHPRIPNLAAVVAGPIPPSPADLLSSHRLREAIDQLRKQYRFVVIDSPPVMAATDAAILSALADGVLLVVRSGETPKEAFLRTRDLLASVKCRFLGVVLNAVDVNSPDYYYSYRYYPYGYGNKEASQPHLDS